MSHVNVSSHCSVAIPSSAPGMCWAPPHHVSRYLKQSNRALAKFRHDSLVMLRNPFAAFHQILISFSAAFRQARQVCLDKAQAHGWKLSTRTMTLCESTDGLWHWPHWEGGCKGRQPLTHCQNAIICPINRSSAPAPYSRSRVSSLLLAASIA